MYQKKNEEDIRNPLEYGMSILSGKWKTRIICLLSELRPMRYGEIKINLVNVSDGVLASTLNELIRNGLIVKEIENDENMLVEYKLTSKGESVIPLLHALCRWSGKYYKDASGIPMAHCLECDYYKHWEAEANRKQD